MRRFALCCIRADGTRHDCTCTAPTMQAALAKMLKRFASVSSIVPLD